jgi:hypothetical protein
MGAKVARNWSSRMDPKNGEGQHPSPQKAEMIHLKLNVLNWCIDYFNLASTVLHALRNVQRQLNSL